MSTITQSAGCTICYAVYPAAAALPALDGRAMPNRSWKGMGRVRLLAFKRGPRHLRVPC